MASQLLRRYLLFLVLAATGMNLNAQKNVPLGIHYQAVARDNYGNELVNRKISVKFSIISGDPLASAIYQELHNDILTSRFGVFSLVIGRGTPSLSMPCTNFSQIAWGEANHFLKVEVKFENDFMDMGTMPFLAVPYALYAQKSLEPGPEGPRGERGEQGEPGRDGDPATDNQTLSFDGSNLTISGTTSTVNLTPLLQTLQVSNDGTGGYNLGLSRGNVINLATIEKDGDPQNEIQDLAYNPSSRELTLLKSTAPAINLSELKNDADADPANEIQALSFNPAENKLYLTNSVPADLSSLKNDADADPANELQSLAFNKITGDLTISSKPPVNLNNLIGFKARKSTTQTGLTIGTTYPFINSEAEFIEGDCYSISSGNFNAPSTGIYTFYVYYKADGSGSARVLSMLKNEVVYEILGPDISAGTELYKWVVVKLNQGDIIRLTLNTGMSTYSGSGFFLGYRVN